MILRCTTTLWHSEQNGSSGSIKALEIDARTIVFGFGRRICLGRNLANTTVFLSLARSLTVFNVTKAVENGNGRG